MGRSLREIGLRRRPLQAARPAAYARGVTTLRWLLLVAMIGCATAPRPAAQPPGSAPPAEAQAPSPAIAACDAHQASISHDADARAGTWSIAQHLAKNFPDGRVSWLMKDASYQKFIVVPAAVSWGRCDDTGCYVFAAPAAVIHGAVEHSMSGGHHDPTALGTALGLPAANLEGPLRMMTLDVNTVPACARLPVDTDPGVWKCTSADDTSCFKFGGYTSGGVAEIIVINAPVGKTTIEEVP
jgi:hypothetical protein